MLNKIISYYNRIPLFIRNKYMVTFILFLGWMVFFDTHNIISQTQSYLELREARAKKEYLINEIRNSKEELTTLLNDKRSLEKFAREKYLMKKEDEDLFIIVEQ